ncbi:unnamed protein product, partial [marine sediment metagenome]
FWHQLKPHQIDHIVMEKFLALLFGALVLTSQGLGNPIE